jgi:hypothetical protein
MPEPLFQQRMLIQRMVERERAELPLPPWHRHQNTGSTALIEGSSAVLSQR